MSHISNLHALKEKCGSTGDCAQYEQQLQQEHARIDKSTVGLDQSVIAGGIFVGVIGLFILLAAFSAPVRRLQKYFFLAVAMLVPLVLGWFVGVYAALSVAFTGCFLGVCSLSTGGSPFGFYGYMILGVVVFSVFSVLIYKKRKPFMDYVDRVKPPIWALVGLLVICFALLKTNEGLAHNAESNRALKAQLIR